MACTSFNFGQDNAMHVILNSCPALEIACGWFTRFFKPAICFSPPSFPLFIISFFVCVCVILCQLEHELFAHTHTKKSPPSHPLPSFLFTSGTSIHQRECHLSLPQHLPFSFYNVQVVVAKLLTYPRRNLRTSLSLTVIAHIIDSDACLNEE